MSEPIAEPWRAKIFKIGYSHLASILDWRLGYDCLQLPVLAGVPHDARVLRCFDVPECRSLGVVVSHPSFEPVEEGYRIPEVDEAAFIQFTVLRRQENGDYRIDGDQIGGLSLSRLIEAGAPLNWDRSKAAGPLADIERARQWAMHGLTPPEQLNQPIREMNRCQLAEAGVCEKALNRSGVGDCFILADGSAAKWAEFTLLAGSFEDKPVTLGIGGPVVGKVQQASADTAGNITSDLIIDKDALPPTGSWRDRAPLL